MSGDYSKLSFRPQRNHTGVRLQQGRVQLDSDWNEALAIAQHRTRTETRDVVGLTGVPAGAPGFALRPAPTFDGAADNDMIIGPGRAYVGGKLVDLPRPDLTRLRAVDGLENVYAVVEGPLLRAGQYLAADLQEPPSERVAEVLDLPEGAEEAQRVRLDPGPEEEVLRRFGLWSLGVQPWAPLDARPQGAGPHLAWLEVVERDITVLDAPYLREPALGGPDTTTRQQLVWRVMTAAAADLTDATPPVCRDFAPPWTPLLEPRARMAARTVPGEAEDRPCVVPASGGFRGIENGLWRVQIHGSGILGDADLRVKWARDNAMHRVRLLGIAARQLEVSEIGRDSTTALSAGDWLELTPDPECFEARGGWFIEIDDPNGFELGVRRIVDRDGVTELVDGDGAPDVDALPRTGLLRRWDGGLPVPLETDDWMPLEKGIEVRFAAEAARNGDFWTIPARALTGDIEWPRDGSGVPSLEAPQGLARDVMALALTEGAAAEGALDLLQDCRPVFEPLTAELDFECLGGDGQEVLPDPTGGLTRLPEPCRVGVVRGTTPLAGHLVRFRLAGPGPEGRLLASAGTAEQDVLVSTGREMVVRTNSAGLAEAHLAVTERQADYVVQADLLDAGDPDRGSPHHMPIRFTARASLASEVGFNADNCAFQRADVIAARPATTVQQAIDRLCPEVRLVKLAGDAQIATPGAVLPDPISVGLYWGNTPLAGQVVEFRVISGDAQLENDAARTDDNGVARVALRAGDATARDDGVIRVVATARFDQPTTPEALLFRSQFARGSEEPGLRVTDIQFEAQGDGDFQDMGLGADITAEQLTRGFTLLTEGELDGRTAELWYVAEIWLDLPARRDDNDPFFNLGATRASRLGVVFRIEEGPDGRRNLFNIRPDDQAQSWLGDSGPDILEEFGFNRITGRLVVHGDWVRGREDEGRFVDGEVFADFDSRLGRIQPTGDGRRGGDLVMPFILVPRGRSVRPLGFGAFTLAGGPQSGILNASSAANLSRAFDLSLDRRALSASGVIAPTDVTRPNTQRNVQLAQRSMSQVVMRAPFLNILVPREARPLMRAIEEQIREAIDFNFEVIDTNARTAAGIANAINRNTQLDAVLLTPGMFEELNRSSALRRPLQQTLFIV